MGKQYHTTKKGSIAQCTATVRGCYLGGVHYSEEEYSQLREQGDPTVLVNEYSGSDDTYFGEAKKEYEQAYQNKLKTEKKYLQIEKFNEKILAPFKGLSLHVMKKISVAERKNLLDIIEDTYVENGVSVYDARKILQKMGSNKSIEPIVVNRTASDPHIKEKTEKTVQSLKDNKQFVENVNNYKGFENKIQAYNAALNKSELYRREVLFKDVNSIFIPDVDGELRTKKTKLEQAIKLKQLNVPNNAKEYSASTIEKEQLSVDKNNEINNAWATFDDGRVEKIVGYRKGEGYGKPGALITDKGNEVFDYTRYHSYRKTRINPATVFISNKKGKTLDTGNNKFSITGSLDTGD